MINNNKHLIDTLKQAGKNKQTCFRLYCDIETLTTNRKAKRPTDLQTYTYSFALAYYDNNDELCWALYNHFSDFFNEVSDANIRKTLSFELWFHNGNKYDNHFLLHDMQHDFNLPVKSLYVKNGVGSTNNNTIQISDLTKEEKNNGIILEQRVRSSNSVNLTMFISGRKVTTIDSYPKMNISLAQVGKKLLNLNIITEDLLKTDYNYTKYDMDQPLTYEEAKDYTKRVFTCLSQDELIYIKNDVLLLALGCKHYSKLFNGFDINKMTFTQNIKEQYAQVNELAEFQLLKTYYKNHVAYGEVKLAGLNGFDYYKRFYKGGLNLYNDKYVGTIIKEDGFSIDLNSSYPTVMYKEKLPTFLRYHTDNYNEVIIDTTNDNIMTFFTMTWVNANKYIISRIKSKIIRKAIVKYYNSVDGLVYYNSVMLKLISDICKIEFDKLPCESYSVFDCEYFGARSMIAHNYFIKTQGKMKKALNCTIDTIDPTNIALTDKDKPAEYNFDDSLVQASKVLLNGIYGVPALRAHFDVFTRTKDGNIINNKEGFENKERNIIFSAGVTAFAFRNLFTPLKYLSQEEIDKYFWYCDTDSLYMNKKALKKFPSTMFHKMNLGGWDIEHENITAFYPFNHKKYCLFDSDEDAIIVRCGGVNGETVKQWIKNSNKNIEYFVSNYFKNGSQVTAQHSVRNTMGTISIYTTNVLLEGGNNYLDEYTQLAEDIMAYVRDEAGKQYNSVQDKDMNGQLLYVDTPFGSLGANDIAPLRPTTGCKEAARLVKVMQEYKKLLSR